MIYQKTAIKQALTHMSRKERGGMSMQKVRQLTSEIHGPVTRKSLKNILRGDEALAHKATKRQAVRNILGAVEKTSHPVRPAPQAAEQRKGVPKFMPQQQKPKPAPIQPKPTHKVPVVKPTPEPKKEPKKPIEKKEPLFTPKPSKTVVPQWMRDMSQFKKEEGHEQAPMPGQMTAKRSAQEEAEGSKSAPNLVRGSVPRFTGTSAEIRPDLGKPSVSISESEPSAAPQPPTTAERPAPASPADKPAPPADQPTPSTKTAAEIDAELAAEESSADTAMNETFGGGEEK